MVDYDGLINQEVGYLHKNKDTFLYADVAMRVKIGQVKLPWKRL